MTRLLSDDDVRARLTPELALEGARRALVEAHRGGLHAPPRVRADLGERSLVFTIGGLADGGVGFRVYQTGIEESDQAVLVWDPGGGLAGCIVGVELGAAHTGALGAAAVDALALPDAYVVGVVGSGRQAWTQLWAATAARRIAEVRVFSPTASHRDRFAERARAELGLHAAAVPDARSAVEGAGIVILATRSETPVIEAPRRRPRRTARRSSRRGSSPVSARCSPETRPAGAATRTSRCMRRPASRGRRS